MNLARKITSKRLVSLLFIVLFLLALYFFSNKIGSATISSTVKRASIFGPLVFILLNAITLIIAPISGAPTYFAGFALFGKQVQFLVYLSAVFAGTINFLIAKKLGRRVVIKMVGKDNMDKVDDFTQDYGIGTLIFLRLFQGNLFDFISYAFGLTKVKFLPYFLVTLLAPIPWLLLWYLFLFRFVNSLLDFTLITFISLIPLGSLSIFLAARFKKKQKL